MPNYLYTRRQRQRIEETLRRLSDVPRETEAATGIRWRVDTLMHVVDPTCAAHGFILNDRAYWYSAPQDAIDAAQIAVALLNTKRHEWATTSTAVMPPRHVASRDIIAHMQRRPQGVAGHPRA